MRAWTTMARDVVPGSAALSMIRTPIPRRISQSAKTRPVGPAPTIRTLGLAVNRRADVPWGRRQGAYHRQTSASRDHGACPLPNMGRKRGLAPQIRARLLISRPCRGPTVPPRSVDLVDVFLINA